MYHPLLCSVAIAWLYHQKAGVWFLNSEGDTVKHGYSERACNELTLTAK